MKTAFLRGLLIALILIWSGSTAAADWNTNQNGIVLDGYDVVAYHIQAEAVKGTSDYVAEWQGGTFHFSSDTNRQSFVDDPKRFAPKFNGYCAFAVGAKNAKVPADAKTFKLYNGELLVFFNDLFDGEKFNTKVPWNQQEQVLYQQASANWPVLSQ